MTSHSVVVVASHLQAYLATLLNNWKETVYTQQVFVHVSYIQYTMKGDNSNIVFTILINHPEQKVSDAIECKNEVKRFFY